VTVSTSTEGLVNAGDVYSITCYVRKPAALSAMPVVMWFNPSGVEVHAQVNTTATENVTVVSAAVQFRPLLLSHGGVYTCEVLFSSSLLATLNLSSPVLVTVRSKYEMFCS